MIYSRLGANLEWLARSINRMFVDKGMHRIVENVLRIQDEA